MALDHLRRHQHLSVDALRDALAIDTQRLAVLSDIDDPALALRPLLTAVYASLTPQGRWLFRMLGLHGGPHITVDGAAALVGQPPETVRRGLHELTDAHFLDPIQPGRWLWHDFPRLLAVELVRTHENPYQHIHAVRRWLQRMTRVASAVAASGTDPAGGSEAETALEADAVNLPAMTAAAAQYGQAGLARQLISVLDHAGRSDLAERCHTWSQDQRQNGAAWVVSRTAVPLQPGPRTHH